MTRTAGLLQEITSFDFSGRLLDRLEQWEREVRRYEVMAQDTISDFLRMGLVLNHLPAGQVRNHLLLNAERLRHWDDFKAELTTLYACDNRGGADSMDAVGYQPKGGGKRKKGGGKQKDGGGGKGFECFVCNGTGRYARHCPKNDKKRNKDKNALDDDAAAPLQIKDGDVEEVLALDQDLGGLYITSLELIPQQKPIGRATVRERWVQEGYSWNDSSTPLGPHPTYGQHEGRRRVSGDYDMRCPKNKGRCYLCGGRSKLKKGLSPSRLFEEEDWVLLGVRWIRGYPCCCDEAIDGIAEVSDAQGTWRWH